MMKKSILSIGKALSKAELKEVNGMGRPCSATCYWPGWFVSDWCRTDFCAVGQCDSHGICIPI